MPRRVLACLVVLGMLLFVGSGEGADTKKKAGKGNQMVKGTIKVVDISKSLLIVNQKVKAETVDRELSILPTTEFSVTVGTETKEGTGKEGLLLLEGKEGATVQVKCDKDVQVLKVTVKAKK